LIDLVYCLPLNFYANRMFHFPGSCYAYSGYYEGLDINLQPIFLRLSKDIIL
jgi:hypothetical protein